jgi:hypothetical protein
MNVVAVPTFLHLSSHLAGVEQVYITLQVQIRPGVQKSKIMSTLRIAKTVNIATKMNKILIEDAPTLTESNSRFWKRSMTIFSILTV